jgi:hypothetical protein
MPAPFNLIQTIGSGAVTTFSLAGLDPTLTYKFYVNSTNSDGISPNSNVVTFGAPSLLFTYLPRFFKTVPGTSGVLTQPVTMEDGSDPTSYTWTATLTMLSVILNFPPNTSDDTILDIPAPTMAPTELTNYEWVWFDPASGTFYLSNNYTSWFTNGARLSFNVTATRISDGLVLNGAYYAFQAPPSLEIDPLTTFGFAGSGFQPFGQGTFSQGVVNVRS